MKERLLELLACPECGGEILLREVSEHENSEILTGTLACNNCSGEFKIVRGVPRFAALEKVEQDKADTAKNFGWQWTHFTQEDANYAEQFLGWLKPVKKEFFRDKIVLEGGCGKGRHTRLAADWGAKEVIGIDLSAAVESAFALTRNLPNAHIVQADIFKLPFKQAFDYAFSVGVLHHTPDPKRSFVSLAGKVKPGGHISAWVYGAENNEWIVRFVNPVREGFTSKLNQPALFQLSKLPTAAVFLATKLIYAPLNSNEKTKSLANKLFYNEYLNHLATFGWREQHNIVFDHLVAPTAFYISRQEFESWWLEIGAKDVKITWHNQNSWCGLGKIQ
ncbi:MAG TPA: methyltransferase domain-containing protein [Pyrinomonadaceae bacterium]|nr:methyltransferase domain-containing protein [Pyrinomonadaceae bacterium]